MVCHHLKHSPTLLRRLVELAALCGYDLSNSAISKVRAESHPQDAPDAVSSTEFLGGLTALLGKGTRGRADVVWNQCQSVDGLPGLRWVY